jgi:hypothetical protein
MALQMVETTHVRVVCDACRGVAAELCGRRELFVTARLAAVRKFRAAGWHHDAGQYGRQRDWERAEANGAGRWYCPTCARQTHL